MNHVLLNLLITLSEKQPQFLINYLEINLISNLLMHVYRSNNRLLIIKLLNQLDAEQIFYQSNINEEINEELKRIKFVLNKIKDQELIETFKI
jgi:hypothetical protein